MTKQQHIEKLAEAMFLAAARLDSHPRQSIYVDRYVKFAEVAVEYLANVESETLPDLVDTLLCIATMDVHTRDDERPPAERMRGLAQQALQATGRYTFTKSAVESKWQKVDVATYRLPVRRDLYDYIRRALAARGYGPLPFDVDDPDSPIDLTGIELVPLPTLWQRIFG